MTKAVNPEWPRLAAACLICRDELRGLASDLSAAMAKGSIPRLLIIRTHDVCQRNAAQLGVALKHPSAAFSTRWNSTDVPCWSTSEGGDQ